MDSITTRSNRRLAPNSMHLVIIIHQVLTKQLWSDDHKTMPPLRFVHVHYLHHMFLPPWPVHDYHKPIPNFPVHFFFFSHATNTLKHIGARNIRERGREFEETFTQTWKPRKQNHQYSENTSFSLSSYLFLSFSSSSLSNTTTGPPPAHHRKNRVTAPETSKSDPDTPPTTPTYSASWRRPSTQNWENYGQHVTGIGKSKSLHYSSKISRKSGFSSTTPKRSVSVPESVKRWRPWGVLACPTRWGSTWCRVRRLWSEETFTTSPSKTIPSTSSSPTCSITRCTRTGSLQRSNGRWSRAGCAFYTWCCLDGRINTRLMICTVLNRWWRCSKGLRLSIFGKLMDSDWTPRSCSEKRDRSHGPDWLIFVGFFFFFSLHVLNSYYFFLN